MGGRTDVPGCGLKAGGGAVSAVSKSSSPSVPRESYSHQSRAEHGSDHPTRQKTERERSLRCSEMETTTPELLNHYEVYDPCFPFTTLTHPADFSFYGFTTVQLGQFIFKTVTSTDKES